MLFFLLCMPLLVFAAAEQSVSTPFVPSLQRLCVRVLSRYEIDLPDLGKACAVTDIVAGIDVMVEQAVVSIVDEAYDYVYGDEALPWAEGRQLYLLTCCTQFHREAMLLKREVPYLSAPLLRCMHIASADWQKKQKYKIRSGYTFALVEGTIRTELKKCLFETDIISAIDYKEWRKFDRKRYKKSKKKLLK